MHIIIIFNSLSLLRGDVPSSGVAWIFPLGVRYTLNFLNVI